MTRRPTTYARAMTLSPDGLSLIAGLGVYLFSLAATGVWAEGQAISGVVPGGSDLTQVLCAALAASVPISVTFINYLKARDTKKLADQTAEIAVLTAEREANLGAIRATESQLTAAQVRVKDLTRLAAESARLHGEREATLGKIRSAETEIVAATADVRAQELADLAAEVAAVKAERDAHMAAAQAAEAKLATSQAWVEELNKLSEAADQARAERETLQAQVRDLEAKLGVTK